MKLSAEILKKMLRAVINTRSDELHCGECFDKIDKFIELKLKGKTPEEAMPLVEDHLNRCNSCRQEYEALLIALQNIEVEV